MKFQIAQTEKGAQATNVEVLLPEEDTDILRLDECDVLLE